MTIVDIANTVFSLGVIAGQVFILAAVIYILFLRKSYPKSAEVLGRHGLFFAFLIAVTSMLGSLFYSQIAGFAPCDLCWFQRLFMYPEVLLLGYAVLEKNRTVIKSALIFSTIGGVISLYHNYMYYYNGGLNVFCQLGGLQTSCIKRYVFEFGYITIPMMALTAFVLIITFLVFYKIRPAK